MAGGYGIKISVSGGCHGVGFIMALLALQTIGSGCHSFCSSRRMDIKQE